METIVIPTKRFGTLSLSHLTEQKIDRLNQTKAFSFSQKEVFDQISGDVTYDRARDSSRAERMNMKKTENLTYGEVGFDSMNAIFDILSEEGAFSTTGPKLFYDLGSGSGRSTLAASLLYPFSKAVGIEILSGLFELSTEVRHSFVTFFHNHQSQLEFGSTSELLFYQGSILDKGLQDWSNGDVIFANSTCFSNSMMKSLSEFGDFKVGTYFVTFTTPFDPRSGFEIQRETRLEMSWGGADVFIHKYVGKATEKEEKK